MRIESKESDLTRKMLANYVYARISLVTNEWFRWNKWVTINAIVALKSRASKFIITVISDSNESNSLVALFVAIHILECCAYVHTHALRMRSHSFFPSNTLDCIGVRVHQVQNVIYVRDVELEAKQRKGKSFMENKRNVFAQVFSYI